MGQLNMSLYLKNLKLRYFQTGRKGKSLILDEFCSTSGLSRKHAISIFNGLPLSRKDKPIPRRKYYDPQQLIAPLKAIWLATDQMCGKRLKVALPLWLPHYEKTYGLEEEVKQKLLKISDRTIDRVLQPIRSKYQKRFCGTKPGSLLKNQIAIKTNQWNETMPGFVEADTVAHCGSSLLGDFVWSITLTDIFSGWTENAAVWNKGSHGVLKQLEKIEEVLPFELLGFDSDNGGEFLNHHLIKYFQERKKPVQFTRSRPYHKGDNAHVEQKNWTHVRQLFGYYRFQNPQLVILMNDLYRKELSLLHNYFYPVMKLQDKVRIQSKIKKHYDKPKTPYQRLMASEHVNSFQKEKMRQVFETLNPFELQKTVQQKLRNIFKNVDLKLKGRDTGT
jgi:5S rRNA maturation endonuclease (ribonuclease M5)